MAKRPDAILFDLGETLIHFAHLDRVEMFRRGARAGHAYLSSQGVRLPPVDKFVQSMLWRGRKALLLNRISRYELDIADVFELVIGSIRPKISAEMWREYIRLTYEPLAELSQLDANAHRVLDQLREAGFKIGLISNTFVPDYAIDAHLRRLGLIDKFQRRFYSAKFGIKKPSLSLFRHAVAEMGVRPDRAWHVGDSVLADVLGARRAGLVAVLRQPPNQPLRPVRWWWPIRPHHVIRELDELLALLDVR